MSHIIRLALKDYGNEWRSSGCFILGLAAVLAPLLILFGLKYGVVTSMLQGLIDNPDNRQIRPLGSGHYEPEWFEKMRAREDVAFIVPRTRTLAAGINLRSDKANRILQTELIPSGQDDPLLRNVGRKPAGFANVVLSQSAADKLNVVAGETVEGNIVRRFKGKRERVRIRLLVVGVTRHSVFSRPAVFASLDLVTAAENFRDGREVKELRWPGDRSIEADHYFPSYRLYARSIYDVEGLSHELTVVQGQQVKTSEGNIRTVQSIDKNLTLIFWVIAVAGIAGFTLSLGSSLWANVERKRRELSVLRLVGMRSAGIVLFPIIQSLLTGLLGWLLAVLVYLLVEKIINSRLSSQLEVGQSVCFLLETHFLIALAITLICATIAAFLGGYRAAQIEPSEGLRDI